MSNPLDIYKTEIKFIKGVGEKRSQLLKKLGVNNIYDALHFYPRTYIDFQNTKSIDELIDGETACILVRIDSKGSSNRIRKNLSIFKFKASDDSGKISLTIFNNKFMAEAIEENEEYYFFGRCSFSGRTKQFVPSIMQKSDSVGFLPIYPQTAGISSNILKNIIKNSVDIYLKSNVPDSIPIEIRKRYNLCHESFALNAIHFPYSSFELESAKKRLVFEELFFLQTKMAMIKKSRAAKTEIKINTSYLFDFIKHLPFKLTEAQKRVINEIKNDLLSSHQMNRLIQGDVGSGKTAVAAAALFAVAKSGYQAVFMAPTDILAKQHFSNLTSFFKKEIEVGLLTGSLTAKQKREVKEKISSGEISVVVATHAVLYESAIFNCLALVVIDEQHRFGVNQRSALLSKGEAPHLLAMSATPIPRTLSLVLYGDLDVSIIDQMPKGRKEIKTYCVDSSFSQRIYNFLKQHIENGEQAYIICPMVEENAESDLTSAIEFFNQLKETEFKNYTVGLLHGKLKAKEKNAVMDDFSSGKIQLLVATTVVEVGVDVPNATIALIKNAERFGLSQLHQIRGRIGRGSKESFCILMTDSKSETATKRMNILCKSSNGFEIAEEDLKLRGPGEILGSMQSGLPQFKIASFAEDISIIKEASFAANQLINDDPDLSSDDHAAMKYIIENLYYSNSDFQLN